MARRSSPYDFLDAVNPIFLASWRRWLLNESRLAGGDDVIDELRRFDWEQDLEPTGWYYQRQQQATYVNFPLIFGEMISGFLMRYAPAPDKGINFGKLGKVTTDRQPGRLSQANQVWFNVSGPGNTGNEWNSWWALEMTRAACTGHRWHYCEGPAEDAETGAREQAGFRPWLCSFSPLDVPMWYINNQDELEYLVVRYVDLDPQVNDRGHLEMNAPRLLGAAQDMITGKASPAYRLLGQSFPHELFRGASYLLLVKEGCVRLGDAFAGGGWWKFNPDKELIQGDQGYGEWDETLEGQIPAYQYFYQRASGTKRYPAVSRPGTTELGNAAIGYMNLTSAADFHAWDGAKGITWLRGIDDDGWKLAKAKLDEGSRYIPLQPNENTDDVPDVTPSSAGLADAEVFSQREQSLLSRVQHLGIMEAVGEVKSGTSGQTKQAQFSQMSVPRILHVAQNMAVAQNIALHFLEKRYGYNDPTGSVQWPNRFDLTELVERIRAFFEIERLSGIRSTTLDATAMMQVAEEKGLISDEKTKNKVQGEYEEAGKLRDEALIAENSELPASKNINKDGLKDKSREAGKKADKPGPKMNTGQRRGRGGR